MKNSTAQKLHIISLALFCIAPVFIIPALTVNINYMLGVVFSVTLGYLISEVTEMVMTTKEYR